MKSKKLLCFALLGCIVFSINIASAKSHDNFKKNRSHVTVSYNNFYQTPPRRGPMMAPPPPPPMRYFDRGFGYPCQRRCYMGSPCSGFFGSGLNFGFNISI